MPENILTDLERGDEDCILRFADGSAFRLSYLSIRCRCQCAKLSRGKRINRGLPSSKRRLLASGSRNRELSQWGAMESDSIGLPDARVESTPSNI